MISRCRTILFVFTLVISLAACAPAQPFVHPGVGLTLSDLNYVKANLGKQPWYSGYSDLAADGRSSTNYTMLGPFGYVNRNNAGNYDHEYEWKNDMQAVYNLARMWYFTGNTNYAKKSHDILIAWATTQTNYGGIEASFDLGDYAYRYAGGADILRGTWPGWTAADTASVSNYFNNVFWPVLAIPGLVTQGSQGMEDINAAVAVAVFNDDTNKFNQVLASLLTDANSGLRATYPNGEVSDTGRDQGHAGLYNINLAWTAEVFWKQGVDVFSIFDNRIHACGEYYSRYNGVSLQTNLPYIPIGAPFWGLFNNIGGSPGSGGLDALSPNILHAAYVVRKGISTPYVDLNGLRGGDEEGFIYYKVADTSTAAPPAIASLPATASLTTGLTRADLNGCTPTGSASYSGGTWTLSSGYNGGDPWNYTTANDTVQFVYKQLTGDFTFIARVDSVSTVSGHDKAGLMLRDSLGSASQRAWVAINSNTNTERAVRGWSDLPYGANSASIGSPISKYPYWVRMERLGNVVQTFTSADGASWAPACVAGFSGLSSTVYVGLFGTSLTTGTRSTAKFSNVRITGGNDGEALKAPPAPFAIYASPGAGQVPLHWNESFMATTYNVLRSTTNGGPYNLLVSVTNLFYADTNVTPGTTYFYIVNATNSAGTSANSLQDSATAQLPPQQAPVGLTALPGNARAMLFWIASSGAVSYNVKRSTTSGSGYVLATNITGTTYTDTGLANNTTYYYVIAPVNGAGEGASSSEASVTPSASAATLFWSGAVNGTWDTSTMNWLNSGASATFANGNSVIFDDSAASNATINVSANRSPGIVFANNGADSYTISGSAIAGTGKLIAEGNGVITFSNANTYSGGSTIYSGTVTVGNNTALGSGTITLAGGTLFGGSAGYTLANNILAQTNTSSAIDCTDNLTLNGNLTGSGAITRGTSGTSSLYLGGNNSGFTGIYQDQNNANSITRWTSPNAGSANARWIFNQAQIASRTTPNFGTGTIQFGSISGAGYISQNISGTATLQVGALRLNDTFAGSMQDGAGIIALTKVGTGTLTLTGANSYSGQTTVSNGELLVTASFATRGNCVVAGGFFAVTNSSVTSASISNLTLAAGSGLEFYAISNTATPLLLASNVTVNGSCTVKITGTNGLTAGNSYPLVKYAGTLSGAFGNFQLQMPYGWRGALVNSGSQISLANVAIVSTIQPAMTFSNMGSQLQLWWPPASTGWRLQVNTNLSTTNWLDIAGANATNQVSIPSTNANAFFRLVYP